jgi:hypothetical protein
MVDFSTEGREEAGPGCGDLGFVALDERGLYVCEA